MNLLFINATTNDNLSPIQELEDTGHNVRIANSLPSALQAVKDGDPDLIVVDANLDFDISTTLLHLRNAFNGNMVAYGEDLSPETSQILAHVGIVTVLVSLSDVISQQKQGPDERTSLEAA